MSALPARLTKAEVLGLARFGDKTLRRRIRTGLMPQPIDRNGQGALFDRDSVLKALGMITDAQPAAADVRPAEGVRTNADAFRKARARPLRHDPPPQRRDSPRVLPGPGSPPTLRLASSNPAPDRR